MGGFIDPMVDPIAEATGAVDSNLKPNLRIGDLDGHRVGVANVPGGAAHATTLLEELIGLGARTLLIAGATGALRPGIDVRRPRDRHQCPARRRHLVPLPAAGATRPAPMGRLPGRSSKPPVQ